MMIENKVINYLMIENEVGTPHSRRVISYERPLPRRCTSQKVRYQLD